MAGTLEGGRRAAATIKKKYGVGFYRRIGRIGGSKITPNSGFGCEFVGPDGLTGPERAKEAGRIGGAKSRRGLSKKTLVKMSKELEEVR